MLRFPHLLIQAFKMWRNSIPFTVHPFSEDRIIILSTTFKKWFSYSTMCKVWISRLLIFLISETFLCLNGIWIYLKFWMDYDCCSSFPQIFTTSVCRPDSSEFHRKSSEWKRSLDHWFLRSLVWTLPKFCSWIWDPCKGRFLTVLADCCTCNR